MQLFQDDLDLVVEKVLALPDGERKMRFINIVMHSLRSLKTDVTLNSHFIVLSTIVSKSYNTIDEEEEEDDEIVRDIEI